MKLLKLILSILFYLSFNKKEINQNKFQQNDLNNNINIINSINNFNHDNLFNKILINKHLSHNFEQNYLNNFFNNKVNNDKLNQNKLTNNKLNQNKLTKQSLKNNISSKLFGSRKKYKNNLINYTKLKNINQNYQSGPIKNNINFIKINLTKAVLNKNYQKSLIKNYPEEFFNKNNNNSKLNK